MRKLILAAILAVLLIPSAAHADAFDNAHGGHYCGKSSTGWYLDAGRSTTCSFTRSVYASVKRYQAQHGLSLGERFRVSARSSVTGKTYTMRCNSRGDSTIVVVCYSGSAATMFVHTP